MKKYPEIKITGMQIKSLSKFRLFCKLLTKLEEEFGIKETRITLDDVFVCPWIDMNMIGGTHMERLIKKIAK